jgi:hypothetical protein
MSPRHGCRRRGPKRSRDPVGCAMYVTVAEILARELGRDLLQINPTELLRDLTRSGHDFGQLISSKPKRHGHSDHLLVPP